MNLLNMPKTKILRFCLLFSNVNVFFFRENQRVCKTFTHTPISHLVVISELPRAVLNVVRNSIGTPL